MQMSAAVIIHSLLHVLIDQPAGRVIQIKHSDFVFHQQKVQEIICLSHLTGQRVRILDSVLIPDERRLNKPTSSGAVLWWGSEVFNQSASCFVWVNSERADDYSNFTSSFLNTENSVLPSFHAQRQSQTKLWNRTQCDRWRRKEGCSEGTDGHICSLT